MRLEMQILFFCCLLPLKYSDIMGLKWISNQNMRVKHISSLTKYITFYACGKSNLVNVECHIIKITLKQLKSYTVK